MKALTLWQPWASLLACGAKKYETRSWATSYCGPIAIHAALTPFKRVLRKIFPLHEWQYSPDYTAKRKFVDLVSRFVDVDNLCYGRIIATAELVGCHKMTGLKETLAVQRWNGQIEYRRISEQEQWFGDWSPGRYAWEFDNMVMLPEPIPARGGQRLWNWQDGRGESGRGGNHYE